MAGHNDGKELAIATARRHFFAGDKIDLQKLAAELGVDRSTLFRWVGNREQLLETVMWSLSEPTFRGALEETTNIGAARIADTTGAFSQALIDAPYFRTFLRREPERALRVLTTKASTLQSGLVSAVEKLVQQELDRGNLQHRMSAHDLAYLITRVAESFIYADLITGEQPDATKAAIAIAALLGDADYTPPDYASSRSS
ncbi:TetR/AcrR family transcriptional regulator [Gordonia sp. TBRC 11910]|uniref:TetR/AcrR family transcriptional regulator n=1 Tax=Gordonia asplenii TaxID=2725283 RepID=A0A848L137_9ACTN|nr:QsdR family transcriptional regulator [Gordonia asplenii]NMO04700.1 TetR/AcrR family transcriptional regulator [Gordonia asplenii]